MRNLIISLITMQKTGFAQQKRLSESICFIFDSVVCPLTEAFISGSNGQSEAAKTGRKRKRERERQPAREREREEASQSCMGLDYKVLAKIYPSKRMMDGWMDCQCICNERVNCIIQILIFWMSTQTGRGGLSFQSMATFTVFFCFFHLSFLPPSLPSLISLQLQVLREGHGTHRVMTN